MNAKKWLLGWGIIVIASLCTFIFWVYKVDPFFHYHKPDTETYFYILNNQRAQNDGIVKHFEYDGIITGTSMTENFKASEADQIFDGNFVKVCFSGGSYREINNNVRRALKANPNLKTVIRGLDMLFFLDPDDLMRTDLGVFPDYLYDDNPFNDVKYLLNRDVLFQRVYSMLRKKNEEGFTPGITSFDKYSRWQDRYTYGINTVIPNGISSDFSQTQEHLTDADIEMIKGNIEANVTSIADEYPNVDFYYFYTPYSVVKWNSWRLDGKLDKICEAEMLITELIVDHKNIHLFSFNNLTGITTDLNNYKDPAHYAAWINSMILKWMHDGTCQLTEENYEEQILKEYEFYSTFDNSLLGGQIDYEDDYYAAALLNKELTGAEPVDVIHSDKIALESDNDSTQFSIDLDQGYNYLCFDGQKIKDDAILSVKVYNSDGYVVAKEENDNPDRQKHSFTLDLSALHGTVTIVLDGNCMDESGADSDSGDTDAAADGNNTNSVDSGYRFSNIYMY